MSADPCLPLLPRTAITITVRAGDGSRFVRLFRSTWARLPASIRRRLLHHWRVCPPRSGPLFSLLPASHIILRGSAGREHPRPSRACVFEHAGNPLVFNADWLATAPDAEIAAVIAHELAHVVQAIEGAADLGSAASEADADRRAAE